MSERLCDWCCEPLPSQWGGRPARFCCRECARQWFLAERREAVALFRAQGLRPQPEPTEAA